jgi:hypothetical protein
MHPSELDPDQLLKSCDARRVRRSGPGGQHRNKVETGVVLVHRPTGVRAEAAERRSQDENRRVAVMRLRVNLALSVRQRRDPQCGPSPGWTSRCHGGRFRVNRAHQEYPALLAEALDVIHLCQYDVSAAADWLTTSSSQLVRFLKQEPRALALVNDCRASRGLHRLRG